MAQLDSFIWYEKYRPRELAALVMVDTTRTALEHFLEKQDIPHLLLHGPAGSGKTTAAQIICEHLPCTVLELNASSGDRGVEVIKTKVKQFAASAPMPGKAMKIVFFDEADGLTLDAQKALRNTIETYQASCRFIFTANHLDKMHDAIRSRCMMFEFSQFPLPAMKKHCCGILRQENVTFDRAAVGQVVERFYPDFRTILNTLHLGSISGAFNASSIAALNIDATVVISHILEGKVGELRRYWAGVSDFTFLYRMMFDEFVPLLAETDPGAAGSMVMQLAEHLNMDATIPDKEMCFASCCVALMRIVGVEPRFV